MNQLKRDRVIIASVHEEPHRNLIGRRKEWKCVSGGHVQAGEGSTLMKYAKVMAATLATEQGSQFNQTLCKKEDLKHQLLFALPCLSLLTKCYVGTF